MASSPTLFSLFASLLIASSKEIGNSLISKSYLLLRAKSFQKLRVLGLRFVSEIIIFSPDETADSASATWNWVTFVSFPFGLYVFQFAPGLIILNLISSLLIFTVLKNSTSSKLFTQVVLPEAETPTVIVSLAISNPIHSNLYKKITATYIT